MAKARELLTIDLDDLVIAKGQVRTTDVQKGIDDLAESISVQGLLQPIVVCESEKKGKYEILAGQRRFLAVKALKLKTIEAVLHVVKDDTHAKVLSLTENLMRRDVTQREKINACTDLYKKFGTIKAVVEETGFPYAEVNLYVKYDRLVPELKKAVDAGKLNMKTALRAQDAAAAGGEEVDAKDAMKLALEMSGMSGVQQKKLVEAREEDPDSSVDDAIEAAKTGAKVTQVVVTLSSETHKSLQSYAHSESVTQDDAAATLIQDGLADKGF